MTRVTTDGSEMRDKCPALTSVMWAPARRAMNVSSAGGMTWSAVPITAQDGIVFQAGGLGEHLPEDVVLDGVRQGVEPNLVRLGQSSAAHDVQRALPGNGHLAATAAGGRC